MELVGDFISEGRLVFHAKCFTQSYYEQQEEVKPNVAWFEAERLPQFLDHLDSAAHFNNERHPGAGVLVGNSVTYVDLAAFHAASAAESQFPAGYALAIGKMPWLAAVRAKVAALPRIAAYMASSRRGLFEGNSMM